MQHISLGSRPGDVLADYIYNLYFAEVLTVVKSRLSAKSQGVRIRQARFDVAQREVDGVGCEVDGFCSVDEVVWVDDAVFFIFANSCQELSDKLGVVLAVVYDTYAEYGLRTNLGVGKTEVMVFPNGNDSLQVRRQYGVEASVDFVSSYDGPLQVKVVGKYKHLGSLQEAGDHNSKEIRRKIALGRSAVGGIAVVFKRSSGVSLQARGQIA